MGVHRQPEDRGPRCRRGTGRPPLVGGATAPPSATSTASAESQEQEQQPEPEPKVDDEAAIVAAEKGLAAAEEKAVPEGAGAPGQLADAAADQAVADAAPTTALAALAAVEVKGRARDGGEERQDGSKTRSVFMRRSTPGQPARSQACLSRSPP
jgi:hypothetical protein